MYSVRHSAVNPSVTGVFAAIIITGMLLCLLPRLTSFSLLPARRDRPDTIIIKDIKPPPPVERVEEREIKPRQIDRKLHALPEITPTPFELAPVTGVDMTSIKIAPFTRVENVPVPVVREIFYPNQVDRKPGLVSHIDPVYPFSARRDGVEGRVVLRFVVNKEGQVENPEVVRAEPEGVFEESALKAIVRYRFSPALIDGIPVKCIVVLPVGFRLNQ
jgi:protein TonB